MTHVRGLTVVSALLLLSSGVTTFDIDVGGLCDVETESCACGSTGLSFVISYKACAAFYRWKPYCRPCGDVNHDEICPQYRYCAECRDVRYGESDGCARCPYNKYGKFCTLDCNCRNGGVCKPDGSCECSAAFHGRYCQHEVAPEVVCRDRGTPSNGQLRSRPSDSYTEGSTVRFECNDGYVLRGSSTSRCEASGSWSHPLPACVKVCRDPGAPTNGAVVRTGYRQQQRQQPPASHHNVGSQLTFRCNDGYRLVGGAQIICLYDGQWNDVLPTCVRVCSLPAIPPNSVIRAPRGRDQVDEGEDVTYACNPGYELTSGSLTRRCQSDGGWSLESPVCKISCGRPEDAPHADMVVSGTVEGDSVTYSCHPGYERTRGNLERWCVSDGRWSGERPRCMKQCDDPGMPTHGSRLWEGEPQREGSAVIYRCNTGYELVGDERRECRPSGNWTGELPHCVMATTCDDPGDVGNADRNVLGSEAPTFLTGTRVVYTCRPPYKIVGHPERRCLSNGTWTGHQPVCTKFAVCEDPGTPLNAIRKVLPPAQGQSGTPRRRVNSRLLTFFGLRPLSHVPAATPDEPSAEGSGGDDPAGRDPEPRSLPPGYHKLHTRLVYSCESQFYKLSGPSQRTCLSHGQWSGRQPTCLPVCGKSPGAKTPFIFNGNVSAEGQWPWQAAILRNVQNSTGHIFFYLICGGAVLNDEWIITAAHCVTFPDSSAVIDLDNIKVKLGKFYRDEALDDDYVQEFQVDEIHVHRQFEPFTLDNDVALIRLSKRATLTDRVRPVCLPTRQTAQTHLRAGSEGVAIGWGTTETGEVAAQLKHARVPVIDPDTCEAAYAEKNIGLTVTRNMFCAGYEEGKVDACAGDSGGPIVFQTGEGEEKRWVLEGLVSWGSPEGCGLPMQYGGYVKLVKFVRWIDSFI
ncbi:clotting factor C-like [Branchiostoma floridae x Branchiostoma belcheri]